MLEEKNDVLKENEIKANRMLAIALLITVGLFLYLIVMITIYPEYIQLSTPLFEKSVMVIGIVFMLTGAGFSWHYKHDKPWLKMSLMIDYIIGISILHIFFGHIISILLVMPIVLSSRYFSKKYTRNVSLLCFIVFFFTSILGVFYGTCDANNLFLPEGSVLHLGNNISVGLAMANGDIPYDINEMIFYTLEEGYSGNTIQGLVVAIVCYLIAGHGRELVLKQQKLTENSTRVGAELALATKIQADVLPSLFPAFPQRKEFDLFASMNPAKEVGGDFYDFFLVDDDHLALVIADVSGKGVPAAMFMMATKNIIATKAMLGNSPAETLRMANDAVCANNSEDMFVTVWIGVLTISTGHMVCSSAGHEYPVLKQGSGEYELLKDKHGMPVGFIDGAEYEDYEIQFEPDDKLFVYTDGVPEATKIDKEMYGTDRIVSALNRDINASCEMMITNIWEDVGEFIAGAEQFDDLTMLSFEYRGR